MGFSRKQSEKLNFEAKSVEFAAKMGPKFRILSLPVDNAEPLLPM